MKNLEIRWGVENIFGQRFPGWMRRENVPKEQMRDTPIELLVLRGGENEEEAEGIKEIRYEDYV